MRLLRFFAISMHWATALTSAGATEGNPLRGSPGTPSGSLHCQVALSLKPGPELVSSVPGGQTGKPLPGPHQGGGTLGWGGGGWRLLYIMCL